MSKPRELSLDRKILDGKILGGKILDGKMLYASDIDRTLVFSKKYMQDYPVNCDYEPCEYKSDDHGNKDTIGFISTKVKVELGEINKNEKCLFIPVTTRTLGEYARVDLGFIPEFSVVENGGTILHKGMPVREYEDFIYSKLNVEDLIKLEEDLHIFDDYLLDGKIRNISCKFIMFKVKPNKFDALDRKMQKFMAGYPNFKHFRHRGKCYVIPNCISKEIALHWICNNYNALTGNGDIDKVLASGDGVLDLPMLSYADIAVIPNHGEIVVNRDLYVINSSNIIYVNGGMESALNTINIVRNACKKEE